MDLPRLMYEEGQGEYENKVGLFASLRAIDKDEESKGPLQISEEDALNISLQDDV